MSALTKGRMSRIKKAGGLDLAVAAGVHLYPGAFAVLTGGYVEPGASGLGLKPAGKVVEEADNTNGGNGAITCFVEFLDEKSLFPFIGDSGHLFTQANIGGPAYLLDDQSVTTVSAGHSPIGTAWKFETVNGIQTVWVELENLADEGLEARVEALESEEAAIPLVQKGTGAMVAGVLTVAAGVVITANSVIVCTRKTKAGTAGVTYDAPSADRTIGAAGVGAFKVRSYANDGTAQGADTSTIDYVIVG